MKASSNPRPILLRGASAQLMKRVLIWGKRTLQFIYQAVWDLVATVIFFVRNTLFFSKKNYLIWGVFGLCLFSFLDSHLSNSGIFSPEYRVSTFLSDLQEEDIASAKTQLLDANSHLPQLLRLLEWTANESPPRIERRKAANHTVYLRAIFESGVGELRVEKHLGIWRIADIRLVPNWRRTWL